MSENTPRFASGRGSGVRPSPRWRRCVVSVGTPRDRSGAALRGLRRHASRPFWCVLRYPSAVLSQYVSRVLVGFEYKDSSIRLAFPWLPLFPPLAYILEGHSPPSSFRARDPAHTDLPVCSR